MDKIIITGGAKLKGAIEISGAKNAALPLMAAALLTEGKLALTRVPYLADVVTMANLLVQHGCTLEIADHKPNGRKYGRAMTLCAKNVANFTAPYDLVRTMRASVLVLGPLLARFGQAKVSLPGGCAIGTRPIDLHLAALQKMGAVIELADGYVNAAVKGRLKGAEIVFDKVTVTGTENILMAATLADGETVLRNAASEPEVSDLARCLVSMGAKIDGTGTDTLRIEGVESLRGATHDVIADRIEAGTYAAAAAIAGGDVELLGVPLELLGSVVSTFAEAGVQMRATPGGVRVTRAGDLRAVEVTTQPYPGFPTDMQAQLMALMSIASGESHITETIFENRFMHVPELARMGADIQAQGSAALVRGVAELRGAEVMATDLRASVSLVIAALAAKGETVINRIYHLDRGYEALEEKLGVVGARIERVGARSKAKAA